MGTVPRPGGCNGRSCHAAIAGADAPGPDRGKDAEHWLRVSDDVRHLAQRGPAQAETCRARRTGNGRPSGVDDVPPVAARSPGGQAGKIVARHKAVIARSEATKQSRTGVSAHGLLRYARNDGVAALGTIA